MTHRSWFESFVCFYTGASAAHSLGGRIFDAIWCLLTAVLFYSAVRLIDAQAVARMTP